MHTHPASAMRLFKIGTIMCVLWLGATMMLVTTAHAPLRAALVRLHLNESTGGIRKPVPLPQVPMRSTSPQSPRRMPDGHRLLLANA
jgi:hypothetical protein